MASSHVRDVEALEAFRLGLVKFASDGSELIQQIRAVVRRAQLHFGNERPAYWRAQLRIAEREFNEAKDNLARKRAAVRASDRLPATEAATRVNRAERRIRLCMEKERQARSVAIDVAQHCDKILGPLADVGERFDVAVPAAARQLNQLIDQLQTYLEKRPPSA